MWYEFRSSDLYVCARGESEDEALLRALSDIPDGAMLGGIIAIRLCNGPGQRKCPRRLRYISTEGVCKRFGLWADDTPTEVTEAPKEEEVTMKYETCEKCGLEVKAGTLEKSADGLMVCMVCLYEED